MRNVVLQWRSNLLDDEAFLRLDLEGVSVDIEKEKETNVLYMILRLDCF